MLAGCSAPAEEGRAAPTPAERGAFAGDGTGRPGRGRELSILAIGLCDLVVVLYRGWTDDAPGTAIQNGAEAASPCPLRARSTGTVSALPRATCENG